MLPARSGSPTFSVGERGMRISFFPPHRLLSPHVAHIWVVESPTGWRPEDIKTIVHNGRMKLVFPYRGALLNGEATPGGPRRPFQKNPENTLWVLGISDRPWIVDSDGPFGVLSVELHPGAAYPFFPFALRDLANLVVPAPDVFGQAGRQMQERLAEEPSAEGKVELVQSFLLGFFTDLRSPDPVVRHAVSLIQARRGLISIGELTEKLGYSQRYIAMKFDRFVGLGPKTLAEIVRFQNRFVALTRYGSPGGDGDFDEDYYDQSHFIREFKRFSGLPPSAYARATNEFLTLFYGGRAGSGNLPLRSGGKA